MFKNSVLMKTVWLLSLTLLFVCDVYGETAKIRYLVTDLGTLGGDSGTIARSINNKGQIAGASCMGSSIVHPYLYSNGSMKDLGTFGGTYGEAVFVSNLGQVVGSANVTSDTFSKAFLYSEGLMTDIGDSIKPWGINEKGQISCTILYVDRNHAGLYFGGVLKDIGTLGGQSSGAFDIDNSGQMVGISDTEGQEVTHAFSYSNGSMKDLGTLGGDFSCAYKINDKGQIVGYSTIKGDVVAHAFLYSSGSMKDLGSLGGHSSIAHGINTHGQVVGQVLPDSTSESSHGFLYSDGVMVDLNDLIIAKSDWTIEKAISINDSGQIVGYGRHGLYPQRAFLLTPFSTEVIEQKPEEPRYGELPIKEAGKDSLVVVTHGWDNRFLNPITPSNFDWVDDMSNNISIYLAGHGMNTWQVFGYKWTKNSWTFTAPDALYNARGEGANLGDAVALQGWKNIHLIGHSAGANLIQTASEWIKAISPNTTVQCTFLDAYIGNDKAGINSYGNGNDWSDSYFSHDVTGEVTEQPLVHSYNVDVTQLGPKTGVTRFRSQITGQMEVCTRTLKYHGWPIDFYMNTITGNNIDSDYEGFGFLLSKEGNVWNTATTYLPGNGTYGHSEPIKILGIPDPSCISDIKIIPPTWPSWIPDFVNSPIIQSDTGSNQKGFGFLNLTTGSPSWIATVLTPTSPINSISFDARFSDVIGSRNILSVYWDTNKVGTVDERTVHLGFQHYSLRFSNVIANNTHVLSFRIDTLTDVKSSVMLTNIVLTQIGPSQPFTLTTTTNKVDGLPVLKFTGELGFVYGIQASTNITSTNWVDIAELINTNGTVLFYDQDFKNYPIRFYRGVVEQ